MWSNWTSPSKFTCADSFTEGYVGHIQAPRSLRLVNSALDSEGNIYAVGTTIYSGMLEQGVLVKMSPNGVILWQKHYGGSNGNEGFYGVAISAADEVYVCGTDNSSQGTREGIVMRLDLLGNVLWKKTIGHSSDYEYFRAIHVDAQGNIFTVGGEASYAFNDRQNAFIVKMNSSGDVLWNRTLGKDEFEYFEAVTTDSNGDVYAVGMEWASTQTSYSGLIAKISTDGSLLWQRGFDGGGGHENFYAIVIDENDNIFVGGSERTTTGEHESILVRYDTQGNVLWQKKNPDSSPNAIRSLVYKNGYLYGVECDGSRAVVVSFDFNGNIVWANELNASSSQTFWAINILPNNQLVAIGDTSAFSATSDSLIATLPSSGVRYEGGLDTPMDSLSWETLDRYSQNISFLTKSLGLDFNNPSFSVATSAFTESVLDAVITSVEY